MPQLEFDLEALGLRLEPTIAMRQGKQLVFQCANCGTVVVRTSLSLRPDGLGPCPSCTKPDQGWWIQPDIGVEEGIAGLRLIKETSS